MQLSTIESCLTKRQLAYGRFKVMLGHNDNFFSLDIEMYGWPKFLQWWEQNEEAYILQFAQPSGLQVNILIATIDE